MPFSKKTWIDRQTEYPTRRKLTATGTPDVYDVSREEGLVTQDGDAFDSTNMNDLENRVEAGLEEALPKAGGTMTGPLVAGGAQAIGTAQMRNIIASTTDLTAGVSSLATGQIYLVYE